MSLAVVLCLSLQGPTLAVVTGCIERFSVFVRSADCTLVYVFSDEWRVHEQFTFFVGVEGALPARVTRTWAFKASVFS